MYKSERLYKGDEVLKRMTSKQPLFEHAENYNKWSTHRDSNDTSLKSDQQSGNVSLMTNTSRRLPLRITQDSNRLTINLASHDPDLSQESNSTCRKTNSRVKSATVCSMNSACLTPQPLRPATGLHSDGAAVKKSGIPVAMKAKKNEHLIKIIQENCDKKRVLPCDAFVVPLLALSDYYSSDGYKKKTNTAANINIDKKSKLKK